MRATAKFYGPFDVELAFPTWARSDHNGLREKNKRRILDHFDGLWTKTENKHSGRIKDRMRVRWFAEHARIYIEVEGWTITNALDKELFPELIWDMMELINDVEK